MPRLTEFRKRRAAHLSGGMQKKLALACTLIHQPEIIFLDEPTTGVDPVSRREFWDILTELHLQGITIFVSTPYMDEAERCSRVGLMYEGKIIVCDTPDQIKGLVAGELMEVRPSDLRRAEQVVSRWMACWRSRPTATCCTSLWTASADRQEHCWRRCRRRASRCIGLAPDPAADGRGIHLAGAQADGCAGPAPTLGRRRRAARGTGG